MDPHNLIISNIFLTAPGDIPSCEEYRICWQKGEKCIRHNISSVIGVKFRVCTRKTPWNFHWGLKNDSKVYSSHIKTRKFSQTSDVRYISRVRKNLHLWNTVYEERCLGSCSFSFLPNTWKQLSSGWSYVSISFNL